MTTTFPIKQDSLGPPLEATLLKGDGTPQDLSGATVTFWMEQERTKVIKVNGAAVTVVSPAAGTVRYTWATGNTDTPGMYRGEFQVAGLSPTPVRFPSDDYVYVDVLPKVS